MDSNIYFFDPQAFACHCMASVTMQHLIWQD